MQFTNKTNLDDKEFSSLTSTIPNTTSLLDLMVWGKKKSVHILDVVKLDEYTFDVIMVLGSNLFLVPDVT